MAGRTNRPAWETPNEDRKPILYGPHQMVRTPNGADSFLPSGAVDYIPGPRPPRPTGNAARNGSSSRTGNVSGNGNNNGNGNGNGNGNDNGNGNGNGNDNVNNGNVNGNGVAPFVPSYGPPAPCEIGCVKCEPPTLPPLSTCCPPWYPPEIRYPRTAAASNPFAPIYPPSSSTFAPHEPPGGMRPSVSLPSMSRNAATSCRCLVCSDPSPNRCFQSQLARQIELIGMAWEEEHAHIEQVRLRLESIIREESRITMDHYRGLWEAERVQLRNEIQYLNEQVKRLGDENLVLRSEAADRHQQAGEPIIHHGSFQGNTPLVDGSPPSPRASRQSGDAPRFDGAREDFFPTGPLGYFASLLAFDYPASPHIRPSALLPPAHVFASAPGSPMPPLASASANLPTRHTSMSPQPGHGTTPMSPVFPPPYSASPSPLPECESPVAGASAPTRSPKRPLSVIDVHELDPKLEGISLRASAIRKPTFKEAPSDESPPSKRRRSLSQEYYIVSRLKEEDDEADVKKTEADVKKSVEDVDETDVKKTEEDVDETDVKMSEQDEEETDVKMSEQDEEETDMKMSEQDEEERRLTMYAGCTPIHSPSPRPGHSQGSPTPTASSVLPQGRNVLKTEDGDATATAAEHGDESSRASISGLSGQRGRADSCSSDSCSQGVLSVASGDAPLKGPLMIKNIPAQDELFLAALNEKLAPISQGQDALPRVVQTPVAMSPPHDAVHVKMEDTHTDSLSGADEDKQDAHIKVEQPAVHIRRPGQPAFAHDGTAIKMELRDPEFFYARDADDVPVKRESSPVVAVKKEDSDDDSGSASPEPVVALKFKSTSNFGAPFGKM
ncbi:hypothetical protein V8C35DRAFT_145899 [Trichoderma chlorosporum]